MANWVKILVPIVVAIIGAGSFVSAIINGIISALFTPNIQISGEPLNPKDQNRVLIDITNNGTAAAKNLRLTVQAPPNTSFSRPFLSTEKYIENETTATGILFTVT